MITFDEFKKLDIRLAEVKEVTPHPAADRLYVIKVAAGPEETTIVAGIRPFYKEEELVGKKVVVVWNIDPAVIRGVESRGMLLAASEEGSLGVVTVDRNIPSGAKVK
ncbi:MAG: hypothetical protein PHE61_04485 [Candidatus Omnitrophica bacterium]|nr:hypothetical protein [Candidatus Omnitrophota bacterium]